MDPTHGPNSLTRLVDSTRGPDSWTRLVDPTCGPTHGLNSWTRLIYPTPGPNLWTQLVDPTCGPDLWPVARGLKNEELFRIGLVDRPCAGGVRLVDRGHVEP